jgi:CRP/FNR family transcriptional regulator
LIRYADYTDYKDKIMSKLAPHSSCTICQLNPFCLNDDKCAPTSECLTTRTHREVSLKRGETLSWSSEKFQNLYVIRHGAIKTFQTEANGNELIRGFYFVGEVLGYEAINTGFYPFSAVALGDTEVCEIPFASILELLRTKPELQKRILDLLSKQLTIGYYLQSSAEQRLSAFLIDLAVRLNADQTNPEFLLPMSRQDIGNYLRLTAETVSRICSKLTSNKIIHTDHKKVRLINLEMLHQISTGLII